MAIRIILTSLMLLPLAGNADPACGTNPQARALAALILAHEAQQRAELQCNDLLAEIAAARAVQLMTEKKPGDLTANQVVTQGGFKFASFYPPAGNQVEAVARETETPESTLDYLVGSYHHRDLVLGQGEFFSRQSQMGVGYHRSEDGQTRWVVLIAEPYSSPKIVIKPEFDTPETITVEECGKTWRSSRNDELRKVCRERWLRKKDGQQEK